MINANFYNKDGDDNDLFLCNGCFRDSNLKTTQSDFVYQVIAF